VQVDGHRPAARPRVVHEALARQAQPQQAPLF